MGSFGQPKAGGNPSTNPTVSMLTRTTWPTRRTMDSGSSGRLGSEVRSPPGPAKTMEPAPYLILMTTIIATT